MLFIAKYVVNRLLRDNQWDRIGVEDPYSMQVEVKRRGKVVTKKVPRPIPDGVNDNDAQVLKEFRKRAVRYDQWFLWGLIKFGWSLIVNLVPVAGPVVLMYWLLLLLWLTRKLSDPFPLDLLLLFLLNIALDFGLGLIPVVGSLVAIGYKANSRNYGLLDRHLQRIGQRNLGNITNEEVRPGFINDKLQPVLEKDVLPGVVEASGKVAGVVQEQILPRLKKTAKDAVNSAQGKHEGIHEETVSVGST